MLWSHTTGLLQYRPGRTFAVELANLEKIAARKWLLSARHPLRISRKTRRLLALARARSKTDLA